MIVDDFFGRGVVVKRVDSEVATGGILSMRAKFIVTQNAAMPVGRLRFRGWCSECGRFDDLLTKYDMNKLKASADNAGASEKRTNLFRRRIGCHVKVFGLEPDDQIADGSADNVGLIAFVLQDFTDLDGVT